MKTTHFLFDCLFTLSAKGLSGAFDPENPSSEDKHAGLI